MTGRDLRNFVLAHRAESRESDQLVQRITDGLGSTKYKAVDYEALKAITQQKKFQGQAALVKVKKLQDASRRNKEQNLVNQHKGVWQKEYQRLHTIRRKLESELAYGINQQAGAIPKDDHAGLGPLFGEIEAYRGIEELTKARNAFKEETYDPVMELRSDLKFMAERSSCDNPDEVLEEVEKVRKQQGYIMERLRHEEDVMEQELTAGDLPTIDEIHDFSNYSRLRVQTGIPEEAFDLACPDVDFKASILQEFIMLDQRYMLKLDALEAQHSTMTGDLTGSWSTADHHAFLYCTEQYPADVQNRRTLYIDMLRRHLPHKNRAMIVEHEEWWMYFQHYHRRTKALLIDWHRDRAELLNRAKCMFAEMAAAERDRAAKRENSKRQQQLCDVLYAKVAQWREEKLEAMKIEEEMAERRRIESLEEMRREEERARHKREKEKQKIQQFKSEKTKEQKEQEARDQERLETLKKKWAEQAKVDKERVQYREDQFRHKLEEQAEREKQRLVEEQEKEDILEALRQKVRPHVEGDLLRLWSDTETWTAHTQGKEEYINIQKPLYEIRTFSEKQVNSDARVRLDNELRAQGLQNHPYARHMMAQMAPPKPPRPDMASTVFKTQQQ